jgi:hypothetical protein
MTVCHGVICQRLFFVSAVCSLEVTVNLLAHHKHVLEHRHNAQLPEDAIWDGILTAREGRRTEPEPLFRFEV